MSKSECGDSESESDDSESESRDSESESGDSESESDDSESESDDSESESDDSESESDFNSVFMNLDICIFWFYIYTFLNKLADGFCKQCKYNAYFFRISLPKKFVFLTLAFKHLYLYIN